MLTDDAVAAGRFLERLAWTDALVLSPDEAAELGPTGPAVLVVADQAMSVAEARQLAALAGAGRSVAILSRQPLAADVTAWLPADVPHWDGVIGARGSAVDAPRPDVAGTFADSLRTEVRDEWDYYSSGDADYEFEDEDPDAPWPTLELHLPDRQDRNWRVSVGFDRWDTEYWYSGNTALLFAPCSLVGVDARVVLMPSMGETYQNAGGLMGMASIAFTGSAYAAMRTDGSMYESSHRQICFGGIEPVWDRGGGQDPWFVPSQYRSEPAASGPLPAGLPYLKTQLLLVGASLGLGKAALIHGIPAVMADVPALNSVLAGFAAAGGRD